MMPKLSFIMLPLRHKTHVTEEEADFTRLYLSRLSSLLQLREFGLGLVDVYTYPLGGAIPLWLVSLSSCVSDMSLDLDVVDLTGLSGTAIDFGRAIDAIAASGSDALAFSPFTNNYDVAAELAKGIRVATGGDPLCLIGGVHASYTSSECLDDGFDVVFTGRAEASFPRWVLEWSESDASAEQIRKLPRARRMIPEGPDADRRALAVDLTAGYRFYRAYHEDVLPVARVYTSYGCPYNCHFCADKIWNNRRPVYRPLADVARELDCIRDLYGINTFFVGDETATLDRDYLEQIAGIFAARASQWMVQTRADRVDAEIAAILSGAGCRLVCIGCESTDDRILKGLNKGITVQDIARSCRICKEQGLEVLTYWMVAGRDPGNRAGYGPVHSRSDWLWHDGPRRVFHLRPVPWNARL
jgi:hypothetical protein